MINIEKVFSLPLVFEESDFLENILGEKNGRDKGIFIYTGYV